MKRFSGQKRLARSARFFIIISLVLLSLDPARPQQTAPIPPIDNPSTSNPNGTPNPSASPATAAEPAPVAPDNSAPAPRVREKKIVGAPGTAAQAPTQNGPIVRDIEIEYVGPHSVAQSVILSNMRTTVGQPYVAGAVEEDVHNLAATGFFTNLRISDQPEGDGVKVIVIVQPKPIVKDIVIVGAKQIKEAKVKKQIKSKVASTLNEQQVSLDADKIKTLYLDKGFSHVEVSYKIEPNEQFGRALVTFIINEGDRAYVTNIQFTGNTHLTSKELLKVMKTKKKDWLSFFTKSGVYKEDQFQKDLNQLRDYYYSKGFIDMQVQDTKFTPGTVKPGEVTVVISIFEGIQYTVGKIDFSGNALFTNDELRVYRSVSVIKMVEGSVYSPRPFTKAGKEPDMTLPTLEGDKKRISDLYGTRGYIEAVITPVRQANVESGKIDLLYQIEEKSQSYIDEIIIRGNNRTKDKVIRRELANNPGEIYDSVKADASKARLMNLDYFEDVDITPEDTNVPNRKNMVVAVKEKRTGSITFGAGFSSVDSLLGFVEISQGNFDAFNYPYFTGGGEKFRIRLEYGLERNDATISFKEPWFLEQQLALGYDLFYHDAQYLSNFYQERNLGVDTSLSRAFGPFWSGTVTYTLQNTDLYNFQNNPSPQLLQEQGGHSESSVTLGVNYDTRNSFTLPTQGEHTSFTSEFVGGPLQGSTNIYKFNFQGAKYISLPDDLILSLSGATGTVDYYGSSYEVPIFERLFVGGSGSVRGFRDRYIGPKDENNEPLGGLTEANGSVEVTFPIMSHVRGAVFNDVGFDDPRAFHYTDAWSELRAAAGMGLRLNLPIGPINLDYGVPYKYSHDASRWGRFTFDVGYKF